jgi:hypothetical protein
VDQTVYDSARAHALAMPAYDFSWWSLMLDPTFVTILVFAVFLMALSRWSPLGRKYIKKQSDYLDHQRSIGDRVVEQNKAFEDMIAKQYVETNERTDKALAQSDEAIRLHAASLEHLASMNQALTRLAAVLEADKGGQPA